MVLRILVIIKKDGDEFYTKDDGFWLNPDGFKDKKVIVIGRKRENNKFYSVLTNDEKTIALNKHFDIGANVVIVIGEQALNKYIEKYEECLKIFNLLDKLVSSNKTKHKDIIIRLLSFLHNNELIKFSPEMGETNSGEKYGLFEVFQKQLELFMNEYCE